MAKGKMKTDRKQNKEIKTLKKKVKALEAPIERKFLDVAMTGYLTANNETFVLNNVGIADQDGTITNNNVNMSRRVGKAIHMTRLRIQGCVGIDADYSQSPNFCDQEGRMRMVVLRWLQNDGAQVSTPKDFLTAANYGASYSPEDALIDGYKRKFPANRYEVLYDRVVYLQAPSQIGAGATQGNGAVLPNVRKVDIDIKLKHDANWALQESSTSPSQNPLCLYLFAGNHCDSLGTQRYPILLNSRLDYVDA